MNDFIVLEVSHKKVGREELGSYGLVSLASAPGMIQEYILLEGVLKCMKNKWVIQDRLASPREGCT